MHVLVHTQSGIIQGYGTMPDERPGPDWTVIEIDDAERATFAAIGHKQLDRDGTVRVLPLTADEQAALALRPGPIMTPERGEATRVVREKAQADPAFAALLTLMGIETGEE